MKVKDLPVRVSDGWGQGHFGASRGTRSHNGTDYLCHTGESITSHVDGVVTKIGYPYADDLSFRYVEVTTKDGLRHRWFYVSPSVAVGDSIMVGGRVGAVQDIQARYKKKNPARYMGNHVHYEVLDKSGKALNPNRYI